jgi:AraC-like DNA-binding protein
MTQSSILKRQPRPVSSAAYFETRQRLDQARTYMDSRYAAPLDLDQISNQASFSRFHFIRLFRKVYKRTPHQYLTQRRIEQAKVLLTSSDLSVTDVCLTVGFQSLGSFSQLFHKLVGQSPSDFRARILDRRLNPHKYVPGCFLMMAGLEPLST